MYILAFIFIFVLGTIIGSFLNVVIYRFNSGKSISKGRSICMACNKTLRWYELIPVLSFLIQQGRCRRCATSISHQYPLVELSMGFVFALLAFHFIPVLMYSTTLFVVLVSLFAFIFSLLMVIAVYDIRHKIIPDKLVYVYAFISLVTVFINSLSPGPFLVQPTFIALLAGPICALPFVLLWLVSKGRWMGLGDAKLVLGIGWMLGLSGGLAAITLSFWIGSVVSLAFLFLSKRSIGMRTEIPFAPFLIIGTLIAFLYSLNIFSLASLFHF